MANTSSAKWHHSNPFNAQAACEHCGNVLTHEAWCITRNTAVQYAYQIILEPSKLNLLDSLILHSLGVTWAIRVSGGSEKNSVGTVRS
jgi:hypothetical protein